MSAQVIDLAIARLLAGTGLPASALGSGRWRRETVEMFAYKMPWLAAGLDAIEIADLLDEVQHALDACAPSPSHLTVAARRRTKRTKSAAARKAVAR